jgi:hypothetical protein
MASASTTGFTILAVFGALAAVAAMAFPAFFAFFAFLAFLSGPGSGNGGMDFFFGDFFDDCFGDAARVFLAVRVAIMTPSCAIGTDGN